MDFNITDLQTFHLSELKLSTDYEFQLTNNIRLGHLAEKIVSLLIKSSSNYRMLYENIQIIEDKKTLGEIDFIVENTISNQIIHIEFAYKFYLFDASISSEPIKNWIGPNRNDSLERKLEKLKNKQFPLLYHKCTKSKLNNLIIAELSQALCLLVSLFIPYECKQYFSPAYQKAIKGYYFNLDKFRSLHNTKKTYYIPPKKEWGINPADNDIWTDYYTVEKEISKCIGEKQSPLCWQKEEDSYSVFFIIWW